MTTRERIADWLTGGMITEVMWRRGMMIGCAAREAELVIRLRDIAAQETPGANATVRRMAKIAREALKCP